MLALNATMLYLGTAAGAAMGGAVIASLGYRGLPAVSAVLIAALYDRTYARPACCCKGNNGNLPSREVLLVFEIRVCGNQHLKPFFFGRAQEFAVFQSSPAKLISGGNAMT